MMKALSVIELAQLYGVNRQSIYKRINKGDLSKNSDGKIDLSEAIRVFGEPSNYNKNVTLSHSSTVQNETEVDMLKKQVDMLKKQLELAYEREIFQREQLEVKDNQIEAIQRLLEAPKSQRVENSTPIPPHQQEGDTLKETTEVETKSERIAVSEHVKSEPKKRSFLSRLLLK